MWFGLIAAGAWGGGLVGYALQPEPEGVQITLTFTGQDSGRTSVQVPSRWAGHKRLGDGITDLRCAIEDCRVAGGGSVRTVHHPPGAQVELTWTLVQDFQGDVAEGERYYRPLIGERGVHFAAVAGLVIPGLDDGSEPHDLVLSWRDLPDGWQAADSWGHGADRVWSGTLEELARGLLVAGPVDLAVTPVGAGSLGVAWVGPVGVQREQTTAELTRTVAAQRAYWEDEGSPWFLVSLMDVGDTCCVFAGTGLQHAFAAFIATDGEHDPRQVQHLLAHELFHAYNGVAMRPAGPEAEMYWFTEGFTEYGSRLIALQTGALTLDAYVAEINAVLRDYEANPYRDASTKVVRRKFWKDYDAERLPYQQGELLALRWRALLAGAGSLDEVLRELLAAGEPVTPSAIDAAITRRRDIGAARDMAALARGERVTLPDDALGPCFAPGEVAIDVFDPGFDVDGSAKAGAAVGVVPGGAAHAAGLRDGAAITGLSVYPGDLERPVVVGTRSADGTEQRIEFLPVGQGTQPGFVRIRDAACDAWADVALAP